MLLCPALSVPKYIEKFPWTIWSQGVYFKSTIGTAQKISDTVEELNLV